MIIFIYLKVQVLVRMIIFIACGGRKSNLSGSLGSFIHDEHRISPIFLLFDAFFLDTILQDCISPVKRQCLNDEQRIRPFLGFRTDGDLPSLELSHGKINSQKNALHVFWVWLFDNQGPWNLFYQFASFLWKGSVWMMNKGSGLFLVFKLTVHYGMHFEKKRLREQEFLFRIVIKTR